MAVGDITDNLAPKVPTPSCTAPSRPSLRRGVALCGPTRSGDRVAAAAARGFTLIEVLAALLLVVIVLPVVMRGIAYGTGVAAAARHRTEAASLAQSKLSEIVATGLWENGNLSGRFDVEDPTLDGDDYAWDTDVREWTIADVRQIDLTVRWNGRGGVEQSVKLTTLVYPAPAPAAGATDAAGGDPAAGGGAGPTR